MYYDREAATRNTQSHRAASKSARILTNGFTDVLTMGKRAPTLTATKRKRSSVFISVE